MSTFNLFVQLAAATGRPVVFFDFETAGLDAPRPGGTRAGTRHLGAPAAV